METCDKTKGVYCFTCKKLMINKMMKCTQTRLGPLAICEECFIINKDNLDEVEDNFIRTRIKQILKK